MGGIISVVGVAQYAYETVTSETLEIHIQWYVLVIIGLVIILISSLIKAYSLHREIMQKAKIDTEQERYKLIDKMHQLARLPVSGSTEPLSLGVTVKTDNRSMSNIFPEIPSDKKGIFFKIGSISVGLINVQNNSIEPVDVEINYEILNGNVPILLQNRVDTVPLYFQNRVFRSLTVNPKGNICSGFVAYALVDRFHKGFKFPSYLSSNDKQLKYRIEGRINTFTIGANKVGKFPYLDIRLRVIATSAVNISKVQEDVFVYRIKANPTTSELTLESHNTEKAV